MARKAEDGLLYFPLNTDIVHSSKVKLVVAEFGPKAWALLLPLLCKIYREKGYWLDWYDEDGKLLFVKDECSLETPFANEVVAGLVRRGFFDKTVFETFGILTSDRIQENFLEAKKRNKTIELIEEFLLVDDNVNIMPLNVNIIPLNVNIISKNVSIGTQKKRKEKKIEENTYAQMQQSYNDLEKSKLSIVKFIRDNKPQFIMPFIELWNIFASEKKKSQVKTVTDMRVKKFSVRINEEPFDFIQILSKAKDSEFLMTKSFFTFDWVVENQDNYVQILEGKYDNDKVNKEQKKLDQEKELMKSLGL